MARLLVIAHLLGTAILATALLLPASANAEGHRAHHSNASRPTYHQSSTRQARAHVSTRRAFTNPVALALKLAERYWHGAPVCGTPAIATSPAQLPTAAYESTTSPEPTDSVVEMWTEVEPCRITINAALWRSWLEDDESFQWFCDAMTHEVGHLFGHPDGGQTNPSSITYPFLSETSPNFNSVPECQGVTLHHGLEEIRNQEIISAQ